MNHLSILTLRIFAGLITICLCLHPCDAQSDGDAKSLWERRQTLAKELDAQLAEFRSWCTENKATAPTELSSLRINRDQQRQYIFLPSETGFAEGDQAHQKLQEIRRSHAEKVFSLAKKQSTAKNASFAYQLLNEVLHFHPDHAEVRKILGHRKSKNDETDWNVTSDRLRIRKATRIHSEFKWPKKSYFLASTAHFEISSRASEAETKALARKLERWHDIWRQVFFDYWSNPAALERWISGKGSVRIPTKKFKVIFFADKQEYVQELSRSVPGIEVSTGYYDDRQKTSFFYAGDQTTEDTWRHELTHQLFSESTRTIKSPFENQFLWLGEGIAMYFESLVEHDGYVTLGGFDSRRLQFARRRCIKEQFFVPLKMLSQADQTEFQTHPNRAKIYSQSAGVTHFLMNSAKGKLQKPLSEFLKLSYQGKLKTDSFAKILGTSFEKLEKDYKDFLKVQPDQIAKHLLAPKQRTELAIPGTKLTVQDFKAIGKCTNLIWVDLSAMDVRGARLEQLTSCTNLEQIFLTGCLIDKDTIMAIAKMNKLEEIDLSGTDLTDEMLVTLSNLANLKAINALGTKVTDEGAKKINPNCRVSR